MKEEATDKIMTKKKEDEELLVRRNAIRKLLQRHSHSIRSLQALSEKEETRAGELAAAVGRKKKQQHGAEVEQQLQERRRMDITNCVQRCSISLQSLRSLSIQESRRHEEQNCRAIPEGHDDEHEIDDGGDTDTGTAFDDDTVAVSDSIQNTTLSLLSQSLASWLDRDDSDSDSNSTNNYDTGK